MMFRGPYSSTKQVTGSGDEALRVVRDALVANGFTVTPAGSGAIDATGPGYNSSKENPIRGISHAKVRLQGSALAMEAELGGVARTGWFVTLFPFALGAVLAGIAWLQGRNAVSPLLATGAWLIGGPLIARHMRNRTVNAIEALLSSAAQSMTARSH